MNTFTRLLCCTIFSLALSPPGCRSLKDYPFGKGIGTTLPAPNQKLHLQYHSVGCFYLEYNGTALLSDPYWSHIPLRSIMFGKIKTDTPQVDPYLPPLDNVEAVMVSHGHHDHVLELPYISPKISPETPVLASQSIKYQYAAAGLKQEILAVDSMIATYDANGEWIWTPSKKVRIMAVKSGHPPQFLGLHFAKGSHDSALTEFPLKSKHFQEGPTLAWLIDFMNPDETTVAYRIYLQTSSMQWPIGFFPESILNEKKVDVAILALDNARYTAAGEERSLFKFLDADMVLYCHWEDFFKPKTNGPKANIKAKLWKLKKKLDAVEGLNYVFPAWNSVYEF